MSGSVAHLRAAPALDPLLTKQQLAQHLRRSSRWVELRVREGMPSEPPTKRYPTRRFRLQAVETWLAAGDQEKPAGSMERIARLEEQVATLAATVERLQRKAS